ncbi:AAA family ATPase [Winogradskyella sp. A3E31]|uniref:AAA family ATPase n=1 Tax=Winogradskyella sp. A3E31 TaxID=3349637 RepID=UPI00398AC3C4
MNTKIITITGGPGTGKSSIINELLKRGYTCFEEISRQVTLEARQQGIEQLFLTKPLLFSEKLLEGRKNQFLEAIKADEDLVFLDRGLPDILAYMDYIGDTYPDNFIETCKAYTYDKAFILAPWESIFKSDNERYENFEQSQVIHTHLIDTYKRFGYDLINVPFESVEKRTDFILESIPL